MTRSLIFTTQEIRENSGLTFAETAPVEEIVQASEESGSPRETFGDAFVSGTCTVRLEFSVGGERILLEGSVRGQWVLECSRCLAHHPVPFESAVDETYPLASETIDAAEQVRQALILGLPDKPLCSPSCRGLCARCGAELNLGPCGCKHKGGPRASGAPLP